MKLSENEKIQRHDKKNLETMAKTFLAGGVAGICAKTCVAPLDRVKILLQAHNQHYKHLGVFSALRRVVKREGPRGLYKANGVQMIRVFPYAAIQFMSYEQYTKIIKTYANHHTLVVRLFAGSLAGMTAVATTYPLDVVRARIAFHVSGPHDGLIGTARLVMLEGGPKALFRGIVPSLLGMAPYAGLSFFSFESLKYLCLEYFPGALGNPCPNNTGGLVLILPAKVLCGGLAGATAQTVAYPMDVVRRRIQLAGMLPDSHKYTKSWVRTLVVVYQDDGLLRGLYRGMSVNYIRVTPLVAVSFSTYEMAKQYLGLDTGVDR